ncbi:MAG: hypothetical protein NT075_11495 [Chloroflexi bacterium]|nr:hypothetical protein [Chloroflexota bacterium]
MRIRPTRSPQRKVVAGLHLIALLLLGLQLYVRTYPPTPTPIPEPATPEAVWWGFWPVTYVASWVVAIGAGLVIGLIVLFWLLDLYIPKARHEAASSKPSETLSQSHFAVLLGMSTLLILAFFAFPIVHTRWGDAYLIAKALAWPDPAQRLSYSWQAPLDVFLHSQLWLYGHAHFAWRNALAVYRLLSPIAGILYLAVVVRLAHDAPRPSAWLTFGLLTSLGLLQLFFGYIENYSFMAVGVLAYLWLALGVLQGNRSLWLAATVLAITNATHPSTIILTPSLLYCGWQVTARQAQRNPKQRNQLLFSNVLQIALPMLFVATATLGLMTNGGHGVQALFTTDRPGGSDARFFVPLWKTSTRWEQYTMFSWAHLRDFLNEQMLVAPVVLPSLLWLAISTKWMVWKGQTAQPVTRTTPTSTFLMIAAFAYLLFTWVWNADYGGQRDWDLFSPAALPLTLWLLACLSNALPERRYLWAGTMPLLMIQWLHTIAWIYQNTLPWQWPK